jgi:RNA polymerase sigma-70 factor (ECF subfamily)
MVYGLAVLAPMAMARAARRQSTHRVDCEAASPTDGRRDVDGVRVEDSAIPSYIARARAGDTEALGALFDLFRPDVLRLCTRLLGPIDADDSANEAFQRAQHRFDGYDIAQPFRRWLLAIAAHHCIDRLRRRSVEKRLFDSQDSDLEEFAGSSNSALDELVQARRQSAVREAIDGLPERYRAPLVLRYFADLDYDAIASELDLTRAQVATSLFRAKRKLRSALRNEQESRS